ncbi:MAG: hypothetical protein IPM21_09010 [Acidobacteria bacterium]|nr:hypothetical protein [Acidobacteriota bacterium]
MGWFFDSRSYWEPAGGYGRGRAGTEPVGLHGLWRGERDAEACGGAWLCGPERDAEGLTGYEKDAETGLDFTQARYYNATHGRFTSVDPLTASAATLRCSNGTFRFDRASDLG